MHPDKCKMVSSILLIEMNVRITHRFAALSSKLSERWKYCRKREHSYIIFSSLCYLWRLRKPTWIGRGVDFVLWKQHCRKSNSVSPLLRVYRVRVIQHNDDKGHLRRQNRERALGVHFANPRALGWDKYRPDAAYSYPHSWASAVVRR